MPTWPALAGGTKLTTNRVWVLPVLGLTDVPDVWAAAAPAVRPAQARTRNVSRSRLDIEASLPVTRRRMHAKLRSLPGD